jgi:hypothetical protein
MPPKTIMIPLLLPAFRAADDWFVDQWLFELVPEEEKAEIDEHYHLIMNWKGQKDDYHMIIGSAMIIAQAEKYLKIKTNKADFIDVFLSIKPEKPSVKKLQSLINGILKIYTPYEVALSDNRWILNVMAK